MLLRWLDQFDQIFHFTRESLLAGHYPNLLLLRVQANDLERRKFTYQIAQWAILGYIHYVSGIEDHCRWSGIEHLLQCIRFAGVNGHKFQSIQMLPQTAGYPFGKKRLT